MRVRVRTAPCTHAQLRCGVAGGLRAVHLNFIVAVIVRQRLVIFCGFRPHILQVTYVFGAPFSDGASANQPTHAPPLCRPQGSAVDIHSNNRERLPGFFHGVGSGAKTTCMLENPRAAVSCWRTEAQHDHLRKCGGGPGRGGYPPKTTAPSFWSLPTFAWKRSFASCTAERSTASSLAPCTPVAGECEPLPCVMCSPHRAPPPSARRAS